MISINKNFDSVDLFFIFFITLYLVTFVLFIGIYISKLFELTKNDKKNAKREKEFVIDTNATMSAETKKELDELTVKIPPSKPRKAKRRPNGTKRKVISVKKTSQVKINKDKDTAKEMPKKTSTKKHTYKKKTGATKKKSTGTKKKTTGKKHTYKKKTSKK